MGEEPMLIVSPADTRDPHALIPVGSEKEAEESRHKKGPRVHRALKGMRSWNLGEENQLTKVLALTCVVPPTGSQRTGTVPIN